MESPPSPESFVIAVRTFMRANIFHTYTLRVIREQGLIDKLYVFVGSDIEEYRALDPDLRYISVPKGAANATRAICDYFEPGQPILFLDDDLSEFFRYDISSDTFAKDSLFDIVVEAFAHAPFDFASITNRLWLRKFPQMGRSYTTLSGCYFGAYNDRSLIPQATSHCDDLSRTISYWRAGLPTYRVMRAGFKTKYAKNPGGLQSSGDRNDTLTVCASIAPFVKDYCSGIVLQDCGYYAWKLLPPATIKKKLLSG